MDVKLKILEVFPEQASMLVRFYEEQLLPQGMEVNVAIPVEHGVVLSGTALIDYISQFAPMGYFEQLESVKTGADISHIQELVGTEIDCTALTPTELKVQRLLAADEAAAAQPSPPGTLPIEPVVV